MRLYSARNNEKYVAVDFSDTYLDNAMGESYDYQYLAYRRYVGAQAFMGIINTFESDGDIDVQPNEYAGYNYVLGLHPVYNYDQHADDEYSVGLGMFAKRPEAEGIESVDIKDDKNAFKLSDLRWPPGTYWGSYLLKGKNNGKYIVKNVNTQATFEVAGTAYLSFGEHLGDDLTIVELKPDEDDKKDIEKAWNTLEEKYSDQNEVVLGLLKYIAYMLKHSGVNTFEVEHDFMFKDAKLIIEGTDYTQDNE
jgi:hypothetical protein